MVLLWHIAHAEKRHMLIQNGTLAFLHLHRAIAHSQGPGVQIREHSISDHGWMQAAGLVLLDLQSKSNEVHETVSNWARPLLHQ